MKPGVRVLVGRQKDDAMRTIQTHATEIGAEMIAVDTNAAWPHNLPRPNLVGDYQIYNAHLALQAVRLLEPDISEDAVHTGLQNIYWPGRMQRLNIESDQEVWLDGGHNEDAGEILRQQIVSWRAQDDKPLSVILGMMSHKDPKGYLSPFIDLADDIHVVPIPYEPHSLQADDIRAITSSSQITQHSSFSEAFDTLLAKNTGRILICGSLYLAGHVLEELKLQRKVFSHDP